MSSLQSTFLFKNLFKKYVIINLRQGSCCPTWYEVPCRASQQLTRGARWHCQSDGWTACRDVPISGEEAGEATLMSINQEGRM